MTPVPPRLHVILARDSDMALLIVRVRTRELCTVGWNRRKDTFEVGQWLRAKIYPLRSDLSPDGTHFVYFAFDGHRLLREQSEAYTAVSRAPWLKALALWPKDDTWTGGGLFLDENTLWVNGAEDSGAVTLRLPGLRIVADLEPLPYQGWEDRRVYYPRLLRDGWTLRGRVDLTPHHEVDTFERPLPHHGALEKSFHGTTEVRKPGRGCYYEEHAILGVSGGRVEHPDWEWADLDAPRRRVVYASDGCLYAVPLDHEGVGAPNLLLDARTLKFEAREAPY